MKIACLGWGSLIWDKRNLAIQGAWSDNGPLLPIEFTRQSSRDRLTLVITQGVSDVQTLWVQMSADNIDDAISNLAAREDIRPENIQRSIGRVTIPNQYNIELEQRIYNWAVHLELDAVIWTNLLPRFGQNDSGFIVPLDNAVAYIQNLIDTNRHAAAEEYIRKAPAQIDTAYRREFISRWNWTNIE